MRPRFALGLLVALSSGSEAAAHEAALSRYTYWEHVRPIFVEHCAGCHREGGVGPMSLLDYQQAVPWAKAIQRKLLERGMPPFLPEDENGPFLGARTLTAEELDVLIDWTVGATPEGAAPGDALDVPLDSSWEPDLVLEASADVVLGGDDYEKTECLVFHPGLPRPRVVSGFEVRSRATTVLHRATVYLGESCTGGEPLLTWLPDQERASFPRGFGRTIPARGTLSLSLVYEKGWEDEGKRIVDRVALGVAIEDDAAPLESVRIERAKTLSRGAVSLVALYPDPVGPLSGEPFRVESVAPDGRTDELLVIEAFDPAWREKYVFRRPVVLAAGSEIRVSPPAVWVDFASDP